MTGAEGTTDLPGRSRRTHVGEIAAVVLAGGLSTRMGQEKAFAVLAGRPLVAHVLERLEPQVGRIFLNVREPEERYLALGRPLALDAAMWRGAGPLAGIAAALSMARSQRFAWLATAPCDTPFLPHDLVERLMAPIVTGEAPAAIAVSEFGLQPMFALWPTDAGPEIEAALQAGRASPRGVLARIGAAHVRFEAGDGPDPFANLNAPADLQAAETAFAR